MDNVAFAVAAHPDDIELMMAGTLLLLGRSGYQLHYMTVANGSCGSDSLSRQQIVETRGREARAAAAALGAVFHGPLVDDMEIYYERSLVARLCAIVRHVRPRVLLIPSLQDYMEDHNNTARLLVTAAFCRGMPNFPTDPQSPPWAGPVALYHALPWGLKDQLRRLVQPDLYVDIASVLERKRQALACHQSQKQWLDVSQGLDSYLTTMADMSQRVGQMSGRLACAEGWQRHLHLGFADENFDPLSQALGDLVLQAPAQEQPHGPTR